MVKLRGIWTPDINCNELADAVFKELAVKQARLTGNEVRFIRHHCEMTLVNFGERFGVTHPAVKNWESHGDETTGMAWTTEKGIRLFVLDKLKANATDFRKAYRGMAKALPARTRRIKCDFAGSLHAFM